MNVLAENQRLDYKSLKKVVDDKGKINGGGLKDLAINCVAFANAQGGQIVIGFEEKDKLPPVTQKIKQTWVNDSLNQLRSLCANTGLNTSVIQTHENGGEFFTIQVYESQKSLASTADGKYYVRVGDQCQPVRSEDMHRLMADKGTFQWELQLKNINVHQIPQANIEKFAQEIRASRRTKEFVKALSDLEIAEHYQLIQGDQLTNLGILWLGTPAQRNRLTYPLTVQYIVYDALENKVRKLDWHDNLLNPKDLLLEIEKSATELTYFDELPQGMFRRQVPHYDARLVRELLINAFAHKSYTISADIFIQVYTDRVEISSPGGLPVGVTAQNILHAKSRRNPCLIKVLHDLELMEGEGTGYNLIYEIISRDAKAFPILDSSYNETRITQTSKILNEDVLLLLDFVAKNYQLSQRDMIVLGIVAKHHKILSTQLYQALQLQNEERMREYVKALLDLDILISRGVKKGTEYLINPKLISSAKINIKPSLKTIEQPRLKALIEETLHRSENLSMAEIHAKMGDIELADVRKAVYALVKIGVLEPHGADRNRKYAMAKKK